MNSALLFALGAVALSLFTVLMALTAIRAKRGAARRDGDGATADTGRSDCDSDGGGGGGGGGD